MLNKVKLTRAKLISYEENQKLPKMLASASCHIFHTCPRDYYSASLHYWSPTLGAPLNRWIIMTIWYGRF